jgi:hypothetical protein
MLGLLASLSLVLVTPSHNLPRGFVMLHPEAPAGTQLEAAHPHNPRRSVVVTVVGHSPQVFVSPQTLQALGLPLEAVEIPLSPIR